MGEHLDVRRRKVVSAREQSFRVVESPELEIDGTKAVRERCVVGSGRFGALEHPCRLIQLSSRRGERVAQLMRGA